MALQYLDHDLPQVLRQVETVGHLHGVRCTTCDALSVGAASIPTDDLDPRMALQPGRQRRGGPIW